MEHFLKPLFYNSPVISLLLGNIEQEVMGPDLELSGPRFTCKTIEEQENQVQVSLLKSTEIYTILFHNDPPPCQRYHRKWFGLPVQIRDTIQAKYPQERVEARCAHFNVSSTKEQKAWGKKQEERKFRSKETWCLCLHIKLKLRKNLFINVYST